MAGGRLIRVTKGGTKPPNSVAYIVAEPDQAKAMEIIIGSVGGIDDEISDLGRVSEALMMTLALAPGQFSPITGVPHIYPKK